MKKSTLLISVLALLGACGSSEEATPATTTDEPAAATAPAAPAAPTAPPAAPAAPAAAATPVAVAGPGFTFTPVTGTAGGPAEGSTLGEGCIGNFPTAPQHIVEVGAAIPNLRVLVAAQGEGDTTLAVRTPGGTVVCTDDSGDPANSFNPVAEIENAAPGTYQIFVGGYSSGDEATSYRLTLGETADQFPSQAMPN